MKNLELTLLSPNVSTMAIEKALTMVESHDLAALTVPPFWVKKLRRNMGNAHPALLATVVGYPFGFGRTETKQIETEWALKDGANEIQVVFNTSAWFSNSNGWPKIELAKLGKLIHAQEALFTVMVESSFFDEENFAKVVKVATDAGVDFIQSSMKSIDYQGFEKMKAAIPISVGFKIATNETYQEAVKSWGKVEIDRLCIPFEHA
ncbi:MAG: deoxyribose-phosphate aldolase [Runella slithyformis]|nr:MAG: deoxyribose-phosphate aldolase [Runella slithyformis]